MEFKQFYYQTRKEFPQFTNNADKLHIERFDEVSEELSYLWFEDLANALNADMNQIKFNQDHLKLLKYLNLQYEHGSPKVKDCIDVAFMENLFWHVPKKGAENFWQNMPSNLKSLYLGFHGKPPL